jgi:hypothetical protein
MPRTPRAWSRGGTPSGETSMFWGGGQGWWRVVTCIVVWCVSADGDAKMPETPRAWSRADTPSGETLSCLSADQKEKSDVVLPHLVDSCDKHR